MHSFCSFILSSPRFYWFGFGGSIHGEEKATNSQVSREMRHAADMKQWASVYFTRLLE
jgi:hypothetical protein